MKRARHPGNEQRNALRAAVLVCSLTVLLFFLSLSIQKIWAADLWWQIRTGEWIVEHRAVPSVDTLSYTAVGREWIEMRWLFCVLAWALWKAGGATAIILAQTVFLALSYAILLWPLRRVVLTISGLAVLVLGIAAGASRFVFRPELVSFVCIPLFLNVLHAFTRGRARRSAWGLPAVQVLWTNAHTLFAFGPALVWLFAAGDTARRMLARFGILEGTKEAAGATTSSRIDRIGDGPARDAGRAAARDVSAAPVSSGPSAPALIDGRLLLLGALVSAACLVNPYALRGALFPFTLFREIHKGSILGQSIREFLSPFSVDTWSWDLYVACALAALTALSFAPLRRRIDPARLAVWGAFVYLACVSIRNVAPFALVSIWTALRNLDDLVAVRERAAALTMDGRGGSRRARPSGRVAAPAGSRPASSKLVPGPGGEDPPDHDVTHEDRSRIVYPTLVPGLGRIAPSVALGAYAALGLLLIAASWYVVTDRFYVRMGAPRRFGLGVVEWNTPARAVEFLRATNPKPQVFSSLADGSYMTWWAKDRYTVFTDGRLEVYGEEFYRRYIDLEKEGWSRFADRHGINTAVLERQYFGWQTVSIVGTPGWVLVHVDPRDLVLVRDIPEHAEIIRSYRIDPRAPWAPRGAEPDERPTGWRRAIGSVETPWYCEGMARNFLALASVENAARSIDLGLQRFPHDAGLRRLSSQVRPHLERRAPGTPR